MNMDWLHYFVILAETKNIHTAAERIGISPPALSKAISSLEKKYNTKLFKRTYKIQGLTPEGEYFLESSRNILNKINDLKDTMEEFRTGEPKGTLKVGGGGLALTYLVPDFFKGLREKYPKIYLKVYGVIAQKIEDYLLEGILDIGFKLAPPDSKELDYRKISEFYFSIIGKPQPKNQWDQFSYIAMKLFENSDISLNDGWPEHGYKRNIIITTENVDMMVKFCELGMGVSFLPEISVLKQIKAGTLSVVADTPFPVNKREMYIIWTRKQGQTVLIHETMKIFFSLFPVFCN